MEKQTQRQKVLNHLKRHGSITSWEAIKEYGATRLAAVVSELRNNHTISVEYEKVKNRQGDTVSIAKYIYVGEKVLN